MPYEIRQISPRKYQVINMLTGKVHSKGTTLKKAKQQVNILHTGEGVVSDTADYFKRKAQSAIDFGKKVIYGRQGLSPKVNKILQEMGDAVIQSATVGRSPVQSFITNIIKVVSTTPYEKLFHLFIILNTTKGDVLLEKNEVINMQKGGAPKNSELIQVPSVPAGLTVQQLIDNTAKYLGDFFIPYDASKANCQDFMMGILTSNNMLTPELKTFVKQDTTDIFKSPWFRKLANTVTDIAGRANVIMQGGGTELIVGGQNETTGADLEEMLKKVKSFKGIFIKDEEAGIKRALRNSGSVVVNLNGTSHWCVLARNKDNWYWFDPFGFPAPLEVEYIIPHDYIYSSDEIQCMKTTSCGFYCVAFIKMMDKFGMTLENYNKFQDMFKRSPQYNEAILAKLLNQLDVRGKGPFTAPLELRQQSQQPVKLPHLPPELIQKIYEMNPTPAQERTKIRSEIRRLTELLHARFDEGVYDESIKDQIDVLKDILKNPGNFQLYRKREQLKQQNKLTGKRDPHTEYIVTSNETDPMYGLGLRVNP